MKVAVLIIISLTYVLSEPPVQNNYLPPFNQFGAPSRPSSSYAIPSFNVQSMAILKPNIQYGAPYKLTQQYGAPGYNYANSGYNRYSEDGPSEPANYNFEYHVQDASYGTDFGHQEARQGDVAQGKYFVLLPDGRRQIVDYVADNEGYKPKISYEGTASAVAGYARGEARGYNSNAGYNNYGYNNGGYSNINNNRYQHNAENNGYHY